MLSFFKEDQRKFAPNKKQQQQQQTASPKPTTATTNKANTSTSSSTASSPGPSKFNNTVDSKSSQSKQNASSDKLKLTSKTQATSITRSASSPPSTQQRQKSRSVSVSNNINNSKRSSAKGLAISKNSKSPESSPVPSSPASSTVSTTTSRSRKRQRTAPPTDVNNEITAIEQSLKLKEQAQRDKRRKESNYIIKRNVFTNDSIDPDNSNIIQSFQVVDRERHEFRLFFADQEDELKERGQSWMPVVQLEYPRKNSQEKFALMHPNIRDGCQYHALSDIQTTIKTILDYFLTSEQSMDLFGYDPNVAKDAFAFLENASREDSPATNTQSPSTHSVPLLRSIQRSINRKESKSFISSIERFNEGIQKLKQDGAIAQNIQNLEGIPAPLWMKIANQAYERTVGPVVENLRQYEAFSDNVYGELTMMFMDLFIRDTNLGPNSVFVDLGSGVSNCVVQASLATGCTSLGIESMETPAKLAQQQIEEVKNRSKELWGIEPGKMECIHGDFLQENKVIDDALKTADVVLVNNYAFSPKTNDALRYKFLDLKENALVISLKPFVSPDFKLKERTIGAPEAIFRLAKREYPRGAVSWTAEAGVFYIQTVDRSRLESFMKSMM